MSRLDDMARRDPARAWRASARFAMLLVAAFVAWTYVAELDEVAVALGEVVPQGNVKLVQHLEGGIVRSILVREGQMVRAGEALLQLELGAESMNREELQVRLDALVLQQARLRAEAEGAPLVLPEAEAGRRPDIARSEQDTYAARARELESTLAVVRERIQQRQLAVRELEATERAAVADLAISSERLKMSEGLLAEGLTARMEHLQFEREVSRLKGQIETLASGIPRAKAALAEARESQKEETLRFRRQASEELGRVEGALAATREMLVRATDQVMRTEITSPTDGIVKNLRFHTLGGIVPPGAPILEIVPSQQRFVVEARLSPADRGYVREGQRAVVKIGSYDFIRYGGLAGEVVLVGADSTTDQNGNSFFRVIVETERGYLGAPDEGLIVTPGMQAAVDIHTGTRSVWEYLIRPVLKLKTEAFRER